MKKGISSLVAILLLTSVVHAADEFVPGELLVGLPTRDAWRAGGCRPQGLLPALATLAAVMRQAEAASFVTTSAMHAARDFHTMTLLPNGKVLVAGGCPCTDSHGANPSAEPHDPAGGTWTPIGPMITLAMNQSPTCCPGAGLELFPSPVKGFSPTNGITL